MYFYAHKKKDLFNIHLSQLILEREGLLVNLFNFS